MGIYIALIALFVAVVCLAIALYREHNEKARISYERDEFGHDLEDLQRLNADAERTEARLRSNMHRQHGELQAVLSREADLQSVLNAWLDKDLSKYKVPARVMTEVGRDGVHYQFNWDPPEQHSVTIPIPITGSGTT